MPAIVCMGVVMRPTAANVEQVGIDDQDHCRNQQEELVIRKELFKDQKTASRQKNQPGGQAVMVFLVAVIHRVTADDQGQHDHSQLKTQVMNDVDAEQWQTGQQQR